MYYFSIIVSKQRLVSQWMISVVDTEPLAALVERLCYVKSYYVARLLLIINNNIRWEWVGRLRA